MVDYRIHDKVSPADLSDVQIQGPIAKQLGNLITQRVTSDFAKTVIYQETEYAFRKREDDNEKIVGRWRGEFWGKWIISACRVCRYLHDETLKVFLHQAALNLIETADEDGYIGTYADPKNVISPKPEDTIAYMGWPCDWNWNVWCRKYTLWGLLECYELTGDEAILTAAEKTTDQLIHMVEEMGLSFRQIGTFNGIPAGSSIKPLLILYRYTENPKYLDFVLRIVRDWEREDGAIPNLISNTFSGKPIHAWYPQSETWAKAYETMSCMDGLLELYRITGEPKYLEAVKAFHHLLRTYERTVLFSVGFNDIFANGKEYINTLTEPCDVIHWMRMCGDLFRLTGDAKYLDDFELAYLNPLQAATYSDGKWGARCVRTAGHHMTATGQSFMQYSHCCVNNLPRGWMNAAEMQVMSGTDGVFINFFTEFSGKAIGKNGAVSVQIGEGYLRDHQLKINVVTQGEEILQIRIPGWCKSAAVAVGDFSAHPQPGFYALRIPAGLTVVELRFDNEVVVHEFHREPEKFEGEDFRYKRLVADENMGQKAVMPDEVFTWTRKAWVQYGPILLAHSKKVGNTEAEMFHSDTICGKGYRCTVTPIPADQVRYAFHAHFENDKDSFDTVMCDFASGSNEWAPNDQKLFNLYI